MKNTVTVLAFKSGSEWTLSSFKGGAILTLNFPTLKAARAYAKSQRWNVRRAADCDS